MIAEILLVLAGHPSSLFSADSQVNSAYQHLLHPGEQQCLEALARIAHRYKNIKDFCTKQSKSSSTYICAMCAKLNEILRNEYESLVVETEAKILNKDSSLVARGSYVPLSSIHAIFSEWDYPLSALESLTDKIQSMPDIQAGALIDLLLERSQNGILRLADIMSRLAVAVQRIWQAQLQALIVHGTMAAKDPIAPNDYVLLDAMTPSCVTSQAKDSIAYIARAVGTVKAAKWNKQIPSTLAISHTRLLDKVLPQEQYAFQQAIMQIRINVSEWLWLNVMTQKDVEESVEYLSKYFLLRNGEYTLSLIREIERLKASRLTSRSGSSSIIREQDLQLALLRASLGTSAQHDPSLALLRFKLPKGSLRPLLPDLLESKDALLSRLQSSPGNARFDDILLGTPLQLTYSIKWPLDLFLHTSDLTSYADLFAFLSSLRHIHTRIHSCWGSLSNAQRARRKWTGLGEGGTEEDRAARHELLRCAWGVVRVMSWFLDVLLSYMMIDVVDNEFRRLKTLILPSTAPSDPTPGPSIGDTEITPATTLASIPPATSIASITSTVPSTAKTHIDFTTLCNHHKAYLDRLLSGSLLNHPTIPRIFRAVFEVCQQFTGQIERWGGDVLPGLLFEGSIAGGDEEAIGKLVKERQVIVGGISQTLNRLVDDFYTELSAFTSHSYSAHKAGELHMSARQTDRVFYDGEVHRSAERLLLRMDFNGHLSRPQMPAVSADLPQAPGES